MSRVRLAPSGPFIGRSIDSDRLTKLTADVSPGAGPGFTTLLSLGGGTVLPVGTKLTSTAVVAWKGAAGEQIEFRIAVYNGVGAFLFNIATYKSPNVPAALAGLNQQATLTGQVDILSAADKYSVKLEALADVGAPVVIGVGQDTSLQVIVSA